MNIAVLQERTHNEKRVAITPDAAKQLIAKGFSIVVETHAGESASFSDADYSAVGATVVSSAQEALSKAAIVVKVQAPTTEEIEQMPTGCAVVSVLQAWKNADIVSAMKQKGIHAFALEKIPRITRAQSMDILSSMATVAGYKAVLMAAAYSGKFFPMLVTAAGTIPPTKALVIGAGVAGLMAISTARRLGAVVESFDVRPAVKEQVESLGAKFIEIDLGESDTETSGGYAKELSEQAKARQQEGLKKHIALADVVITTAAIPGKDAPKIITDDMLSAMKFGSVIVDLAAETGGNTHHTTPGETTIVNGVHILAPVNLASSVPIHASQMFAKNCVNFLSLFVSKEGISVHTNDEILAATCATA